jgi:hypothetical protein
MTITNLTPANSAVFSSTLPLVTSHAAVRTIAALDTARAQAFSLFDQLDNSNWTRVSVGSKRTMGAIAAHLVDSLEMMAPMFISRAQAGKKLCMPWLFATSFGDWISYKMSESRAKKDSLDTLRAAYDAAHAKLVAQVNALPAEAFALSCGLPAPRNEAITIEAYLTQEIKAHFDVHAREIEDTLR